MLFVSFGYLVEAEKYNMKSKLASDTSEYLRVKEVSNTVYYMNFARVSSQKAVVYITKSSEAFNNSIIAFVISILTIPLSFILKSKEKR